MTLEEIFNKFDIRGTIGKRKACDLEIALHRYVADRFESYLNNACCVKCGDKLSKDKSGDLNDHMNSYEFRVTVTNEFIESFQTLCRQKRVYVRDICDFIMVWNEMGDSDSDCDCVDLSDLSFEQLSNAIEQTDEFILMREKAKAYDYLLNKELVDFEHLKEYIQDLQEIVDEKNQKITCENQQEINEKQTEIDEKHNIVMKKYYTQLLKEVEELKKYYQGFNHGK